MKNLQIQLLKIIACSALFFCVSSSFGQNEKLKLADSLFKTKQYTQSLEIYQSVFNEKMYTPSMLLKMAFINEGLGKVGPTLYFLKLYHHATGDEHALKKTAELASMHNLSGYDENDYSRLQRWFGKYSLWIRLGLCFILLIIAATMVLLKKEDKKPWGFVVGVFVVIGLLFYVNNYHSVESGIATGNNIYLMDGPSSGANVVSIVSEGTLLPVMGKEDVWLKVEWTGKEVYLKEKSLLRVEL